MSGEGCSDRQGNKFDTGFPAHTISRHNSAQVETLSPHNSIVAGSRTDTILHSTSSIRLFQ